MFDKHGWWREVFVAQLAELSFMTPEIPSLNPDIGNFIFPSIVFDKLYRQDENKKEKEAGNGPFFKRCRCI